MRISAYVELNGGLDLDFGQVSASERWLLTTDHPASSYGIPVAVRRRDGAVFGPAEMKDTTLIVAGSEENLDPRPSREAIAAELRGYGYVACGNPAS